MVSDIAGILTGKQGPVVPARWSVWDMLMGKHGGSMSGNVMTLTLNGAGGSTIGVSHTDEPFELWMDGTSPVCNGVV